MAVSIFFRALQKGYLGPVAKGTQSPLLLLGHSDIYIYIYIERERERDIIYTNTG